LFSLAGVPPTAGFFGKFFLLLAGAGAGNYVLITIAALNMIVSLYYYLVLVKAMFIDANDSPVQKLNVHILPKLAMVICVTGIMLCGVLSWFYEYIYALSPGF
jgi:NADH-quinone oxidoreductase subunit N